jgi:ABC-type oligopeptide transport system ATPase subunit
LSEVHDPQIAALQRAFPALKSMSAFAIKYVEQLNYIVLVIIGGRVSIIGESLCGKADCSDRSEVGHSQ